MKGDCWSIRGSWAVLYWIVFHSQNNEAAWLKTTAIYSVIKKTVMHFLSVMLS